MREEIEARFQGPRHFFLLAEGARRGPSPRDVEPRHSARDSSTVGRVRDASAPRRPRGGRLAAAGSPRRACPSSHVMTHIPCYSRHSSENWDYMGNYMRVQFSWSCAYCIWRYGMETHFLELCLLYAPTS